MAERMVELAREQEGFIDVESAAARARRLRHHRVLLEDLESIGRWKAQSEHAAAQRMGRDVLVQPQSAASRIARVEREYAAARRQTGRGRQVHEHSGQLPTLRCRAPAPSSRPTRPCGPSSAYP